MQTNKKWKLGLGLGLATLLLLLASLVFWLNSEEKIDLDKVAIGPKDNLCKVIKIKEIRLSLPQKKQKKYPVILLFGGLDYATPDYMLEHCPQYLLSRCIVAAVPCAYQKGRGFKHYISQIESWMSKEQYSMSKLTVCGFSGGAADALQAKHPQLQFLGLIDPEPILPKTTAVPLTLAYYRQNWAGNEVYGEKSNFAHFSRLDLWVRRHGGKAEEVKIPHEKFPTYFLYKHRKKIS
jgi:hypothetical protein